MKALKFFVAGCLVLVGIGVVGTGVTLGEMYKTNQTVFEMNQKEELKATALQNLYIESDVPVRIMPTEGQPYVTFEASGNGVMFPEPKYELEVISEGNASHINLKQVQSSELYIFTNNLHEELVVYMPQQDMDTLKVVAQDYHGLQSFKFASTANIKDLSIDAERIDLNLKGGYTNVEIKAYQGNALIHSNTPAQVKIDGVSNTTLKGQIAQVDVKSNHNSSGGKLIIESDLEAKINIDRGYGETIIDGKVSDVNMTNVTSCVTVNSSTPYNATMNGSEYNMDVKLKGMMQNVTVEGEYGDVRLYPTTTPKRIEILGEQLNIHAVLPESITGFEIKKQTDGYEGEYENQGSYEDQNIFIDFDVKSENINSGLRRIYYGDEAMKMFIGSKYGNVYITK
ncbi:MAG: hypothetical protein RR090_05920 [Niameybacter sp.]